MSSSRLPRWGLALIALLATPFTWAESAPPSLNLNVGPATDLSAVPVQGRHAYSASSAEESALLDMLQDPIRYETNPNGVYNYMWMRQFNEDYEQWEGSYAIFKLLQGGFKRGWDHYRSRNLAKYAYIPDGEGNGKVGGFDYNLRVSNNKIRLQFEYEF